MPDLMCLGELLIDFCSTRPDVGVGDAPGFTKAAGGAPANVAVAAARLGGSAGFIGAVGADPFGDFLVNVLKSEGVDTSALARAAGVKTPLAFVAVRSSGEGDFFFYHDGSACPLREADIRPEYLRPAAALHFGSISRIDPAARAATDKARALAARQGLLVSYDPNYRPRLWPDADTARRVILDGFAGATVAKVSREEWRFLLDTDVFAAGAARFLDSGVQLIIRSEGAEGATYASPRGRGHVSGFAVDCVEFTGAGDAFVGCLLTDLLRHRRDGLGPGDLDFERLSTAIRRANAVGAITTTRPGAMPAMPTRQELEQFLQDRP